MVRRRSCVCTAVRLLPERHPTKNDKFEERERKEEWDNSKANKLNPEQHDNNGSHREDLTQPTPLLVSRRGGECPETRNQPGFSSIPRRLIKSSLS